MLLGSSFLDGINDLVFPRACLMCGTASDFICPFCRNKINTKAVPLCPVCKVENCFNCQSDIDRLWALADYHSFGINKLVTDLKYKYLTGLLDEFWQEKINEFCNRNYFKKEDKILVPIPLHRQKLLRRGFNQSELITAIFINNGCITNNRLLVRKINNQPQAETRGKERLENVRDIFKVNYRELAECWDKEIVLVDDVYTTGATIGEAARVLREKGFKKIDCLVLAVSRG